MKRERTGLMLAVLLALFLVLAGTARAMLHPQGGLAHNATNNVSTLDFTVSLDWNWYGPPTGTWNRTTFTTRMDAFAKSLFAMTEGRHRVGRIYVFPSKKGWNRVDIRFVANRSGTSAANVADWRKATGNIEMYLWENATSKDSHIGPVLAHECGHYVYGVYDEYKNRHPGAQPLANLTDQTSPASDDYDDMPSIMNDHENYPLQFSLAASYPNASTRSTAQWRAYGASIWETLTRSPDRDPEPGKSTGRVRYAALGNVSAPTSLNMPTVGYADALRIVPMQNGTVNVLAFDPGLSSVDFLKARSAAQGVVQGLSLNSSVLVAQGVAANIGQTTITGAAARRALSTRVGALSAAPSQNLNALLRSALANASAARQANQTATVHLLASGNPLVDAALTGEFRAARVGLAVPSLAIAGTTDNAEEGYALAELARDSGGKYHRAKNRMELAAKAQRGASELEADSTAVIAQIYTEAPVPGTPTTFEFYVGTEDQEAGGLIEVLFFTDPADFAKATPTLKTPSGTTLTNATVAAGFSVSTDPGSGCVAFEIDPAAFGAVTGTWTATLTASASLANPVGFIAQATSQLQLAVDMVQLSESRNPLLRASLSLDRSVLGATVTADLYGPDGNLAAGDIPLRDDGTGGDLRADDGVYSVALANLKLNGEYDVVVTASNPDGNAVASSRGAVFANPLVTTAYALGSFQRSAEATAELTAVGSSNGHGCVLGGPGLGWDMGIPALLAAVAGWAARRKNRG
jgi:hypothetical protein